MGNNNGLHRFTEMHSNVPKHSSQQLLCLMRVWLTNHEHRRHRGYWGEVVLVQFTMGKRLHSHQSSTSSVLHQHPVMPWQGFASICGLWGQIPVNYPELALLTGVLVRGVSGMEDFTLSK